MLEHSQKTVRGSLLSDLKEVHLEKVPDENQIWRWHKKFKEEGCLRKIKESGRKSMSEETVDKLRQKILNSPKKSIKRTSFETQIPATTIWRVIRKRLQMIPYKLQLICRYKQPVLILNELFS